MSQENEMQQGETGEGVSGPETDVLVCWTDRAGWDTLGRPSGLVNAAEKAFEKVGAGDPLFRGNVVKFPNVLTPALLPIFIRSMLWSAGSSSTDCFYAAVLPGSGQVVDASAPRDWLPEVSEQGPELQQVS